MLETSRVMTALRDPADPNSKAYIPDAGGEPSPNLFAHVLHSDPVVVHGELLPTGRELLLCSHGALEEGSQFEILLSVQNSNLVGCRFQHQRMVRVATPEDLLQ